uniref:Putative receptor for activated c kinase n=1 Tax=Corethrella appendiculata TaxID=1370023 RepID=U5EZP4_9DIPT
MAGLEIIVGTYEEYTVAYKVDTLKSDPSRHFLKETFSIRNHTGSVRSMAVHQKYLATGGSDDRTCVYDLEKRQELCQFMHHTGIVNTLAFVTDCRTDSCSYLLTGGEDGKMTAINTKSWIVDKTWDNAHKGAVKYISVYPTGSMALSIGSDGKLLTWNLANGRLAFATSLKNKPEFRGKIDIVKWSPDGNHFLLIGGDRIVQILKTDSATIARSLTFDVRPTVACWIDENSVIVGLDNGAVCIFNIDDDEEPETFEIYVKRIKAIDCCGDYLAIASSTEDISLWSIVNNEFTELCNLNIKCRPICIKIVETIKYGLDKAIKNEEEKIDKESVKKLIQTVGHVLIENDDDTMNDSSKTKIDNKKRKNQLKDGILSKKLKKDENKKIQRTPTKNGSASKQKPGDLLRIKKKKKPLKLNKTTSGDSSVKSSFSMLLKKKQRASI